MVRQCTPPNESAPLKIACNDYKRLNYDWWIDSCYPNYNGIEPQYYGDGVENEFSTTNNILQINNLANQLLDYFFQDPNKEPLPANLNNTLPVGPQTNVVDCTINPCSIYAYSFKPELIAKKVKEDDDVQLSGNYLDIFPVPAKDYVFINYHLEDEISNAELLVFNHYGRKVFSKNITSHYGFETLDKNIISSSGIYICIISNNGKISLKKKFIVAK